MLRLLFTVPLQLRDYKPGSSRADLEESRAAARAQQGLEPDSDEVSQWGAGRVMPVSSNGSQGCWTW